MIERIHRCDICKEVIEDKNKEIFISKDIYPLYVFCSKCGRPIIDFLKKHKLKFSGK
ncbi:MAG: hypothetical protein AB1632_14850 [Nitrospirota bacterium]